MLSRFLDGGIDTVLVENLTCLAADTRFHITLAIGMQYDELEVYRSRLPQNVHVVHLVDKPYLTKWKKKKLTGRLPFYVKAYDEVLLNPIRRHLMQTRIDALVEQSDVVVDFDFCAYAFLRHVTKPKIGFLHFSLAQLCRNDPSRIRKIKRNIACYNHVVTISKAMYEEACHAFPSMQDRLCMIYNAINTDELFRKAEDAEADNRLALPYILCVGRLDETPKDVTTLIKAYGLLRSEYGHQEELYVVGKGCSLKQLQEQAVASGVAEHVHFLGFSSNPYPWMKHCRLFVQSSKFEGLPTTMIEALLLDKDIVATDCPTGPKEILNNGKAGLLTPVGDEQTMAKVMHEALTNKALRQEIAKGRAIHKREFTFECTKKKLYQLLASR